LIPTAVKVEVWRRDRGQCVQWRRPKTSTSSTTFHFQRRQQPDSGKRPLLAPKHNPKNRTRSWQSLLGFSPEPSSVGQIQKLPG
jgi:hypothetical protein